MAAGVNPTAAAARQRTKLVVAIALGVTLIVVLCWGGEEPVDDVASSAVPQPAVLAVAAIPTPAAAEGKPDDAGQVAASRLPPVELSRILANNPFSGPAVLSGAAKSSGRAAPTESSAAADPANRQQSVETVPPENKATPTTGDSPTVSVASAGSPEAEPPAISVSGIVIGGGRPAALIGDQLFYENDAIDSQWRIVAIRSHGIVVQSISAPHVRAD